MDDSIDISQLKRVALDIKDTFKVQGIGASTAKIGKPDATIRKLKTCSNALSNATEESPPGIETTHIAGFISENVIATTTMAGSGSAFGSTQVSGDTQPLSPWVYAQRTGASKDPEVEISTAPLTQYENTTVHTLKTGQAGHVDLLGAFEEQHDGVEQESEEEEDDQVQVTQVDIHGELYPESKRFLMPTTPATHGKKRNSRGEVVSSEGRTPGLPVNPFGQTPKGNIGMMGLSQMFRATQATTSPMIHNLSSDIPSNRPSPAMEDFRRPATANALSSPLKESARKEFARAFTEPQTSYTPMMESQKRRRLIGPASSPTTGVNAEDVSSADELDDMDMKVQKERRRRERKKKAVQHLEALSTSGWGRIDNPRNLIEQPGAPRSNAIQSSPVPAARRLPSPMIISEDHPIEAEIVDDTEDETEHEEAMATPEISEDELAEENKENYNTRRVTGPKRGTASLSQSAHSRSRVVRQASSKDMRSSPPMEAADEMDLPNASPVIDRPETIVDSQISPEHLVKGPKLSQHIDRPGSDPSLPSSRVFVPQSQAMPRTSQIDSSLRCQLQEASKVFPTASRQVPTSRTRRSPSSPNQRDETSPREVFSISSHDGDIPSCSRGDNSLEVSSPSKDALNVVQSLITPGASLKAQQQIDTLGNKVRIDHDVTDADGTKYDASLSAARPEGLQTRTDATLVSANTPSSKGRRTLRSTIPETSSITRHRDSTYGFQPIDSINAALSNNQSAPTDLCVSISNPKSSHARVSTAYDTAKTHLTFSNAQSLAGKSSSQTSQAMATPATSPSVTKIAKFTDIPADPSMESTEDIDMPDGLLTKDDLEYHALMEGSSPIHHIKRRRRRNGNGFGATVPEPSSSKPESSPARVEPILDTANTKNTATNTYQSEAELPLQIPENTNPESGAPTVSSKETSLAREVIESQSQSAKIKRTRLGKRGHQMVDHEDHEDRVLIPDGPRDEPVERHESAGLPTDQPRSRRQSRKPEPVITTMSSSPPELLPPRLLVAPNRVFAHFNGSGDGFYPATCLAVLDRSQSRFKIRFDDGTVTTLHANSVKRLELMEGDVVKVDKPGLRAQTFIVESFPENEDTNQLASATLGDNKYPKTDVLGQSRVRVIAKSSSGTSQNSRSRKEVFPVESIYLSQSLFNRLKDRAYKHNVPLQPPLPRILSGLQTPSEISSAPTSPSRRKGRAKNTPIQYAERSSSFVPFQAPQTELFANMTFSITNITDATQRVQILRDIRNHGGLVLDSPQGFDELFNVPDPSQGSENDEEAPANASFALASLASSREFACVIADKHCRSSKFIQALALGIPCLATRWIRDCIAKERTVSWEPYLLASGESAFLGGAVRSRSLPSCIAQATSLQTIIEARPNFLDGASVLLIVGKGKEAEMMQAYPFVAYALGAKKVMKAANLEIARQMLQEANDAGKSIDWVYFYEGSGEWRSDGMVRAQVEQGLFGCTSGTAKEAPVTKRRKRANGAIKTDVATAELTEKRSTRVVSNEFVIQSLILGALIEEEG